MTNVAFLGAPICRYMFVLVFAALYSKNKRKIDIGRHYCFTHYSSLLVFENEKTG